MDDLPNLWTTIDYPVLLQAARILEADLRDEARPDAIANQLDLAAGDVTRSMVRLHEDGYIAGPRADSLVGKSIIATDITAKGRREVGMWPSSKDGAALIEAIENAIKEIDDEDRKGFLRQMAQSAPQAERDSLHAPDDTDR